MIEYAKIVDNVIEEIVDGDLIPEDDSSTWLKVIDVIPPYNQDVSILDPINCIYVISNDYVQRTWVAVPNMIITDSIEISYNDGDENEEKADSQ